jgi:hypothetical protein
LRKPWQLGLPGEEARYAQALAVIAEEIAGAAADIGV